MALELDFQGLLLQLAGTSAIVAGLAWIATVLGKHIIDRNISNYKARLDLENAAAVATLTHQNAAAIEGLRADASKQIERLRSELRVTAYATEVRIADLHKRRADVIAEVYRQIAAVHQAFANAARLQEYAGDKPKRDRLVVAVSAAATLDEYVAQNRIFLPESECAELDTLLAALRTIVRLCAGNCGEWPVGVGDARTERVRDEMTLAWSSVEHELPGLRRVLERSLRKLLGEG